MHRLQTDACVNIVLLTYLQCMKLYIIIIIIIIMLLDLLARFRPRTINKLSEGDSDADLFTIHPLIHLPNHHTYITYITYITSIHHTYITSIHHTYITSNHHTSITFRHPFIIHTIHTSQVKQANNAHECNELLQQEFYTPSPWSIGTGVIRTCCTNTLWRSNPRSIQVSFHWNKKKSLPSRTITNNVQSFIYSNVSMILLCDFVL